MYYFGTYIYQNDIYTDKMNLHSFLKNSGQYAHEAIKIIVLIVHSGKCVS